MSNPSTTETEADLSDERKTKRPRDRANARPTDRANPPTAIKKTKLTLVLDDATAERLHVHAVMRRRERSEIVGELINKYLRQYRVQTLASLDVVAESSDDR